MNTIKRILGYSPQYVFRLTQYFLFAVMGVVFGNIGMAAIIPMFNVLFNKVEAVVAPAVPAFAISKDYFVGLFQHYFISITLDFGPAKALLFVCGFIIVSRLMGGVFLYLERITASRLRIQITKNLRTHIFTKITTLHIGFFNTNRRGDLISRFTSDVHEVDVAINNGLKTVLKEPIAILVTFTMLFLMFD